MKRLLNGDVVFGGTLFVVGMGLFLQTFADQYQDMGVGSVFGPMYYPRIILGVWVALSLLVLSRGFLALDKSALQRRLAPLLTMIILLVIMIAALPFAGFVISTVCFVLLAIPVMGYRRLWPWVLTAALFPPLVWYIFHHLLVIQLPLSRWIEGI